MKISRIICVVSLFVFMLLLSSCASGSTPYAEEVTETPAPEEDFGQSLATSPVQPVLYGLWIKEVNAQRSLIVFTEKSVYLVEVEETDGTAYLRESFYELNAIDWVRGELELHLAWVRVNGKYGGFDSPLKYMKISIDETSLYYSLGDEGTGMPADAVNGPWIKN